MPDWLLKKGFFDERETERKWVIDRRGLNWIKNFLLVKLCFGGTDFQRNFTLQCIEVLYLANQIFSNNAQNSTKYWQVLVLTIEQNEHFPLHKMYPSSVNGMNFQNFSQLEKNLTIRPLKMLKILLISTRPRFSLQHILSSLSVESLFHKNIKYQMYFENPARYAKGSKLEMPSNLYSAFIFLIIVVLAQWSHVPIRNKRGGMSLSPTEIISRYFGLKSNWIAGF